MPEEDRPPESPYRIRRLRIMAERELKRRNLLKLVGYGVAVAIGMGVGWLQIDGDAGEGGRKTATPAPAETATPAGTDAASSTSTPQETPTQTQPPTPTQPPTEVTITDFGAKVDGVTDDTEAILEAIDTVADGGTIVLPAGEIRISVRPDDEGKKINRPALPIERPDDGLTIQGKGPGLSGTRLVLAPGHTKNHKGITIAPEATGRSGDEHSGLTVRDLVLDGNWQEQEPEDGGYPNGFATHIQGEARDVSFVNCLVENWATTGGLMASPGIRIRDCTFRHNGYGIAQDGFNGHGFNANTGGRSGQIVAENCLFVDNTGNGIDVKAGNVTVRDSVFRRHGFGVKINSGSEKVTLENCRMVDSEHMHIHCTPSGNEGTGVLELNSVSMENSKWPAIALGQRPGVLKGDNILIKNADTEDHKDGGVYINSYSPKGDREVDIGVLSIHDTTDNAVDFAVAHGRIGKLVHSGTEGVGETADVDIESKQEGNPIDVSVPESFDVGARNGRLNRPEPRPAASNRSRPGRAQQQ